MHPFRIRPDDHIDGVRGGCGEDPAREEEWPEVADVEGPIEDVSPALGRVEEEAGEVCDEEEEEQH